MSQVELPGRLEKLATTPVAEQSIIQQTLGYLGVRRAIGLIVVSLPWCLMLGAWFIDHQGIENSISAYYYTSMRGFWVGAVCAMGVFTLCYRYRKLDDGMGTISCVCAVLTALFPTNSRGGQANAVTVVHVMASSVLFFVMSLMSLLVFTRSDGEPTAEKGQRNVVYRVCGVIMLAGLAVAGMSALVLHLEDSLFFWCEVLMTEAFGVAWLIKGETLFKDARAATDLTSGRSPESRRS